MTLTFASLLDALSDWSPMHEAAIHGRMLSLRNLIRQGWPVNLVTVDHVSPLHEACLGGHASCVNLLLRHGALVDGVTTDWHTPLFNTCISGNRECLELLLQNGASFLPMSDMTSPIHEASKRGHLECIECLTSYGCNVNHNIGFLGTPLYLACENNHIACAKRLLDSGADVNIGKGLESPLHVAARTTCKELACLLMDFGANVYLRNSENKRPVELVPPDSPLASVFLEREGPPTLMQLCRLRLRQCFGALPHQRVNSLMIPEELKRFLLHH
ncbi:ankyrin repeat and SOCS box protein 9 isoform X1 [Sorex fumeus]|uniref:ankyrin repeat and SOCS box protein 9 isoform X1 n=1 Tax=Sorex fumeus TaxID=62283 RepID=UPI0024AD8E4F|nr:ankyrin repeat and SOCS box protein 9 isoform X1 [Sorex fumeus]